MSSDQPEAIAGSERDAAGFTIADRESVALLQNDVQSSNIGVEEYQYVLEDFTDSLIGAIAMARALLFPASPDGSTGTSTTSANGENTHTSYNSLLRYTPRVFRAITFSLRRAFLSAAERRTLELLNVLASNCEQLRLPRSSSQRDLFMAVVPSLLPILKDIETQLTALINQYDDKGERVNVIRELNDNLMVWQWDTQMLWSDTISQTLLDSVRLKLFGNPPLIPPPNTQDLCPVEIAFMELDSTAHKSQLLDGFINWTNRMTSSLTSYEEFRSRFGAVQSMHLFREKGAPLHHEYAVICVGWTGAEDVGKNSWIRVERGARLKGNGHNLQSSGFGPLFHGAPLREIISFSRSKEGLITRPIDELATVSLSSAEGSPISNPMTLAGLSLCIQDISSASPLYHLLSYNCRWLPRRLVLSFAQRSVEDSSNRWSISWMGSTLSYAEFLKKIRSDHFGGKPLEGKYRRRLQALVNVERAQQLSYDGTHDVEAITVLSDAVSVLRATSPESTSNTRQLSRALQALSRAHQRLQENEKALIIVEELCGLWEAPAAWGLPEGLVGFSRALNEKAAILDTMGRKADALVARQESTSVARRNHRSSTPSTSSATLHLSYCLSEESLLLARLGRIDEAMVAIDEAISLTRELHKQTPNYGVDLSNWLGSKATILSMRAAGEDDQAVVVSDEAITLLRESISGDKEPGAALLPVLLCNHAHFAAQCGRWEVACAAGREALGIWTQLGDASSEPHLHRPNIAFTGWRLGVHLGEAGHLEEALDVMRNSIGEYRACFTTWPDLYRNHLAAVLRDAGDLLERLGRIDEKEHLKGERDTVLGGRDFIEPGPMETHTPLL